jgi:4-hydroxy-3-methylbut-2-enyl diphosphate reductase
VALAKTAIAAGCQRVIRVNGVEELPDDLFGTVGVTAGASAPEELVEAIVARLDPADGVELVQVTDEDEYFPPPSELRNLLRAMAAAVSLALVAPVEPGPLLADDRAISASTVLATLQA